MTWHSWNKNMDRKIRHVLDNKACENIDAILLNFATKSKTIKLGLT